MLQLMIIKFTAKVSLDCVTNNNYRKIEVLTFGKFVIKALYT
ncbi:unnamed protein product [Nezara viridula]|uniref:Uncharacterized protein n=1 Tax=Nezara viridula TaxID=85310 RepID=A0A9P0HKK9_NEZVI|nr:unnamed protein product [Nezara viridula]